MRIENGYTGEVYLWRYRMEYATGNSARHTSITTMAACWWIPASDPKNRKTARFHSQRSVRVVEIVRPVGWNRVHTVSSSSRQ